MLFDNIHTYYTHTHNPRSNNNKLIEGFNILTWDIRRTCGVQKTTANHPSEKKKN